MYGCTDAMCVQETGGLCWFFDVGEPMTSSPVVELISEEANGSNLTHVEVADKICIQRYLFIL